MPRAPSKQVLERALLELLEQRGPATACPSEVARAVGGEHWRDLMPSVRDVAAELQAAGTIDVCQRGRVVKLADAKGPIRLRLRTS